MVRCPSSTGLIFRPHSTLRLLANRGCPGFRYIEIQVERNLVDLRLREVVDVVGRTNQTGFLSPPPGKTHLITGPRALIQFANGRPRASGRLLPYDDHLVADSYDCEQCLRERKREPRQ